MFLGEYKLANSRVTFSGRDRVHVKQKALDYWYANQHMLRMGVREFFARCRLSLDGRAITFDRGSDGKPDKPDKPDKIDGPPAIR